LAFWLLYLQTMKGIAPKLFAPIFLLVTLFAAVGCTDKGEISAQVYDITDGVWVENKAYTHPFEVTDASKPLTINLVVRANKDYGYTNIYIKGTLTDTTGKEIKTEMKEIILNDIATGKPLGSGFGDINEVTASFAKGWQVPAAGKYNLVLKQYMREKRLSGLESVGVQILQP
jgi:gliding motility-associated lipoprotein GldH